MGAVRGIPLFTHNREITVSGLEVKVKEPVRKLFERHKHSSGRRLGMDLGLAGQSSACLSTLLVSLD